MEISSGVEIDLAGTITIGTGTKIGTGSKLLVTSGASVVVGSGVVLKDSVQLESYEEAALEIGDECLLARGCTVAARHLLRVGAKSQLGEYSSLRDHDHRVGADLATGEFDANPLTIGAGTWLGAKVTVARGGSIGDGSVVGANSVVVKKVEPRTVVAGAPARVLRRLDVG